MPLTLKSPAFPAGGKIPRKYTCDGENISPPFAWSGVPATARSLLLVCDDPDGSGGVIQHWAAYNIPPDWTGLKEGYGPENAGGRLSAGHQRLQQARLCWALSAKGRKSSFLSFPPRRSEDGTQ